MTGANAKIKRIYVGDNYLVYPTYKPSNNTICYYPLSDNYSDASGNCSDVVRSNTSSQIGTYHGVKCFNMNNYYSSISTINNMNGLTEYTWSFWLYANTAQVCLLFSQSVDNWGASGLDLGALRFRYGNPTNKYSNFTQPSLNAWHYYAISISGGKSDIYIDGVRDSGLSSGVIAPANNATPLRIGGFYNTTSSGHGDGCLSNFIIEKVGWTAEQVKDYFDSTKKAYGF